jgi:hypothetical protein
MMRTVPKALLRIAGAAALTAALAGTAAAQLPMPSVNLEQEKHRTPQQIEQDKAIDRAYQSATKKIPDQQSSNDPWAGVRSSPPPPAENKKLQSKKQQLTQGAKKPGE